MGVIPCSDEQTSLASVCVIIPARNEKTSLPLVLADLPCVGRVIVVNNASTDDTASVAMSCGAQVVDQPEIGYGAACLAGIAAVERAVLQGEFAEPVVVAFLDADYSDHPDLLPMLVKPVLLGEADLVLGSRLQGRREPGAMPPQSVWGNRLACFLMWLIWGIRYSDLGPFRAISLEALRTLEMCDRNYGWTIEMQIKAAKAGLRIMEIPVPYRRRVGRSKISGTVSGTLRAGYKILGTIAKYAIGSRPARL
jgi:hypothetical protein